MIKEATTMLRNAEHMKMEERAASFLAFANDIQIKSMEQAEEYEKRNQETYVLMKNINRILTKIKRRPMLHTREFLTRKRPLLPRSIKEQKF